MTESETNDTVTKFKYIEALNSENIPYSKIAELDHIVRNLLADKTTSSAVNFTRILNEHIHNNPKAHDISIDEYGQDLILQLYSSYRDMGYTGTIKDMFIAIEKDVKVGTHVDMINGWDTEKAVNTTEWRWRYRKHQNDNDAHKDLLDTFRPKYCLNMEPILAIDYRYFNAQDNTFELLGWDSSEGTVNIELCTDKNTYTDKDILEIRNDNDSFAIHLNINDRGTFITFVFNDNTPMCSIEYETSVPDMYINRISVTYNANRIAIRDLFNTFNLSRPFGEFIPKAMTVNLPVQKSGNGIRTVTVYNRGISVSEQNFFLN